MNILKVFIIVAFLVCGAYAQPKTNENNKKTPTKALVKKTSISKAVGYTTYVATAYSLRGRTASGEMVRNGIIAADRRILPLGTVVHIEGMGVFVVKDVGSAIKGSRVDIWMGSRYNAIKFGRRTIRLRIISYGKNK